MTTLAQFRSSVASRIGLDNTASSEEQGFIDGWVNEGVVEVLKRTKCTVQSATATPGATADYALPTTVLDLVDVYFTSGGQTYEPLERVTVDELLLYRQASTTGTAGPPAKFALAGNGLVMWWPTPSATDTITYYAVVRPTALSASSDTPSSASNGGIPDEYHKAIEVYAFAEAADWADDQTSAQGQRYRDRFNELVGQIRSDLRRKGGRPLRARVGNRLRGWRPHDRSVY